MLYRLSPANDWTEQTQWKKLGQKEKRMLLGSKNNEASSVCAHTDYDDFQMWVGLVKFCNLKHSLGGKLFRPCLGSWASRYHSVQFSRSVVSDSLRPDGLQHANPPCPSPAPGSYSLMCIESVMPFNHLILCRPLLLRPSIFPSIRVFLNKSVLRIRWPEYLEFHLQHQSFQWTPRTDLL